MKIYLKLFLSFFCFFASCFLSCQTKYNDAQFATIMRSVKDGSFSTLLPLTEKKMKLLLNTDEASILCIGLHLHDGGKIEDAKRMFRFGISSCKEPFNIICGEKLFYISNDLEKIALLNEKINSLKLQMKKLKKTEKDTIEEEIKELEEVKKESEFFCLRFEKKSTNIVDLFAKRAMNAKVIIAYSLLDEKQYKMNDSFISLMRLRSLVFGKKYDEAYNVGKSLLESDPASLLVSKYVFYDFMRSFLFGSKEYKDNAFLLKELVEKKSNLIPKESKDDVLYLSHLYLGRLYEKAGRAYYKDALQYYNTAIKEVLSPHDFDDSNWFRLNLELEIDMSLFMRHMSSTMESWDDHEWYEDLVEKSTKEFVARKDYKSLKNLYNIVEKSTLDEQKAKLKYILARVGMIEKKSLASTYKEIYTGKHNQFYYTLLSAYQLNLPIKDVFYKKKVKRNANKLYSSDGAMKILGSYIRYGLYPHIYREAMRIYPTISVSEAWDFSKELYFEGLVPDSINLVQFAINTEGASFTAEHIRSIFPRPYYQEVKKWAKFYDVPEYLMYALIRSESFFRPTVASHAGALGLAQLMPGTAKEIARALKIKEYDVFDPDTNIQFGTYYLSSMIKRFKGRLMPGICSYNAGPVAVSRWLKNTNILEEDIFVESIPYDETRNYGKKLLYTSCMYAYLYYNKTPNQVIKEMYSEVSTLKK